MNLFEWVDEKGFSMQDICNQIENKELIKTLVAYSSHIEGVGSSLSDIDVYAICPDISAVPYDWKHDDCRIRRAKLNGVVLDIEYWEDSTIESILKKLSQYSPNYVPLIQLHELKLISRLYLGELIYGEEFKKRLDWGFFIVYLWNTNRTSSCSLLDDATRLAQQNDFPGAFICAQTAMQYALKGINAKNSITCMQNKWISKIFIDHQGFDSGLVNEYYTNFIYVNVTKDNIEYIIQAQINTIKKAIAYIEKDIPYFQNKK